MKGTKPSGESDGKKLMTLLADDGLAGLSNLFVIERTDDDCGEVATGGEDESCCDVHADQSLSAVSCSAVDCSAVNCSAERSLSVVDQSAERPSGSSRAPVSDKDVNGSIDWKMP